MTATSLARRLEGVESVEGPLAGMHTEPLDSAPGVADAAFGRIAMFIPRLVAGGAEHVMLTLASGFIQRGHAVDLLVVTADGVLLPRVHNSVRLIELATGRAIKSVPALAKYLRRERPAALLSTLNMPNAVAVLAGKVARGTTRVVVRQAAHLSRTIEARPAEARPGAPAPLLLSAVRWSYPRADAIIAVSAGVADDLATRLRMARERIRVVPNPIVTSELAELARRPLDHPWFTAGAEPVILGTGRLARQKRFDVLIRAFAHVRERQGGRLMILGEGEERPQLEALIQELRLEQVVSLPGFIENPFAYMARSSVFVLSSAWEGLPGSLIQALACGAPVVATDCESGPREILQGGRLGRLVPVDDPEGLADAIHATLAEPRVRRPADTLLPFAESAAVDAYLRILQPPRR